MDAMPTNTPMNQQETVTLAHLTRPITKIYKRAESGDANAFALLVDLGGIVAIKVELLREKFPKEAKTIGAPRLMWPLAFVKESEHAELFLWLQKNLHRGFKTGRKSRDINSPATMTALLLRHILETYRADSASPPCRTKNSCSNDSEKKPIDKSVTKPDSDSEGNTDQDLIHEARSLPSLSHRTFSRWFDLGWKMLLQNARDEGPGGSGARKILWRGIDKWESEVIRGVEKATEEWNRSAIERKMRHTPKISVGSLEIQFPEELQFYAKVATVKEQAEKKRAALARKKFRELCAKIWLV